MWSGADPEGTAGEGWCLEGSPDAKGIEAVEGV